MLRTYTTISGDMWDYIAFKTMGNEKYMDVLMAANMEYRNVAIFSGGIVLFIPTASMPKAKKMPPWRR